MRIFYNLLFFLFFHVCLYAQPTWSSQSSGTTNQLNSVYFISNSLGWTVGNEGIIKNTVDGGESWNTQGNTVTTQSLNSVFFRSASLGWIAGNGGEILKTQNGGILWEEKNSGISENLNSVFFRNDTLGWAVGGSGKIIKTINGGNIWTEQSSGSSTLLSSVFFINDTVGWAVGQQGLILHTNNGGTLWTSQISGKTKWLLSVRFTSSTTGYVVGATGTILKTIDGGTTWVPKISTNPGAFNSVRFPEDSIGWIVGNGGAIYKTKNAGETWAAQSSGTTNNLESVSFPSLTDGWAVGAGGAILKYSCKTPDSPMLLLPPGSIHCVGSSITYSVIKDPKVTKYIWTFPVGWEGKSDSSSIPLKATNTSEPGFLTVVAVNGCGNSTSSSLSLTKPSKVSKPTITQEGALLKTEDDANLNYQWKREQELVGTNSSSYEPEKAGMYKVLVTDKTTGCQDSSDAFLYIITATEQKITNADFNFYPNPANDVLTISLGNQISSGDLSILSLEGKEVYQKAIDGGTFDLSLQKIPKGLYVVKLQSVGQSVYKKLSVE